MFWVPVGAQGGHHFLQKMKRTLLLPSVTSSLRPPLGTWGSGDNRLKPVSVGGRTDKEFGVKGGGKQERQGGVGVGVGGRDSSAFGWSSLNETGKPVGPCRAYMSDGLVAEATTWGEALKVALGAKGSPVLLEEAAASQGGGTAAAEEVLRVPGSAQSRNHL